MKLRTTFERKMLREPSLLAALVVVSAISFVIGMLIVERVFPAVMLGMSV